MKGRKVKQHHELEMKSKIDLCSLRYTSETIFSRVTSLALLQDVVSYHNLGLVPFAIEWAFAKSNLQSPLRNPRQRSGLPNDYFDY